MCFKEIFVSAQCIVKEERIFVLWLAATVIGVVSGGEGWRWRARSR